MHYPTTVSVHVGGDGASFAAPAPIRPLSRIRWQKPPLGPKTHWVSRCALRSFLSRTFAHQHLDVLVARFAPSSNVTYAMFAGGGLAWAERKLKQGGYTVPRAPVGVQPTSQVFRADLRRSVPSTASSCLLSSFRARSDFVRGTIRSSCGRSAASNPAYIHCRPKARSLHGPATILIMPSRQAAERCPLRLGLRSACGAVVARVGTLLGIPIGGFHEARFRRELVENTDFRKFDDGLRTTLDCPSELADVIDARLEDAQRRGACFFGTHRQLAANLTCFVPSPTQANHVHFVDGASGGYAFAALNLKREYCDAASVPKDLVRWLRTSNPSDTPFRGPTLRAARAWVSM